MSGFEIVVAVVIVLGIVCTIIPLFPGSLVVASAVTVWAIVTNEPRGWIVLAIALLVLILGMVLQFLIPAKRMNSSGVSTLTLLFGAAMAFAGFFMIPFIGLFLGFVLGIYLAELGRVGSADAWQSTKQALKAVGLSILIEITSCVLVAGIWLFGVLAA